MRTGLKLLFVGGVIGFAVGGMTGSALAGVWGGVIGSVFGAPAAAFLLFVVAVGAKNVTFPPEDEGADGPPGANNADPGKSTET